MSTCALLVHRPRTGREPPERVVVAGARTRDGDCSYARSPCPNPYLHGRVFSCVPNRVEGAPCRSTPPPRRRSSPSTAPPRVTPAPPRSRRSEERRVGKEGRPRGAAAQQQRRRGDCVDED